MRNVWILCSCLFVSSALCEELQVSYPLTGDELSSSFGERIHPVRKYLAHHDGVDLKAAEGTSIYAIGSGKVVFAGAYHGYGNLVVIRHTGSLTSHYGHCSKILVQVGDNVSAGSVVAQVGSTGISTGAHLHFELRAEGVALNPLVVLPGLGQDGEG